MSVISFFLFGWDKHLAVYKKSRIPELLLFMVAVFLGGFGALCGMIIFNHKTKNDLFLFGVPIATVIQVLLLVLVRVI
jgi:uncharacterized membrane protein YsdA (DUF1294 family)